MKSQSTTELIFVTGSQNKVREAERILGRSLKQMNIDLPEIQSLSIEEILEHKARHAYEASGHNPVIVDDTGLFINAWNGLPGPLVKWFLKTVGGEGICRMLDSFSDRSAIARTVIATFYGHGDAELTLYSGEMKGCIADHPRGANGFGWDTIFIPEGESRTYAEMTDDEKDNISMRRMALLKLSM